MPNDQAVAIDPKRKRFVLGMLLAWIPLLIFLAPSVGALISIIRARAGGVGMVAGGVTEAFLLFGVVAMMVCQVSAVTLLLRTLGRDHPFRVFLAGVSIACSTAMIVFVGLVFWFRVFAAA